MRLDRLCVSKVFVSVCRAVTDATIEPIRTESKTTKMINFPGLASLIFGEFMIFSTSALCVVRINRRVPFEFGLKHE